MPILKLEKEISGYTLIPNSVLLNPDLSLAAKGLLCYMLSCREDWKFSIAGLSKVLNTPEYSIKKYLTELADRGYHKKEAIREDGKIKEWKYFISDTPIYDSVPVEEKPQKKSLYQLCMDEISEVYFDEDVKKALEEYLSVRIKSGRLSAKSWKTIILELRDLAETKDKALEVVKQATVRGYMKLYPVKTYSKSTNKFKDDVVPLPMDNEAKLKDKYREEFQCVPKCDRPSFEEWRKTNEMSL